MGSQHRYGELLKDIQYSVSECNFSKYRKVSECGYVSGFSQHLANAASAMRSRKR